MRSSVKSWQNQRPGWTRRITWYEGDDNDIRLKMEDDDGIFHFFTYNRTVAQKTYDLFRNNELSTTEARDAKIRAEIAEMKDAHAEGLHDDFPRQGCPYCEGS